MIKNFDNFNQINEDTHSDYLKWKKQNVTIRGLKDKNQTENNGAAMLGRGLYTAPLSNKTLAKGYGKVYFVVGAVPRKPKIFNTINDWEIWFQNTLVLPVAKRNGKNYPDSRDFFEESTIETEMVKLGYDGIIIKGREMVNFTPNNDRIVYFDNENDLNQYFINNFLGQ